VPQTLTTQTVDLKLGIYYITAKLPTGQELFNQVTIVEDKPGLVTLAPESEDESSHEWLELDRYITGQQPTSFSNIRSLKGPGMQNVVAKLRAFSSNVLIDETKERNDQTWLKPLPTRSQGVAKFLVLPGYVRFVQLLQLEMPPMINALSSSNWCLDEFDLKEVSFHFDNGS
jgi:hypothetical protein